MRSEVPQEGGKLRRRGLAFIAATVVCFVFALSWGSAPAGAHANLLHSELRGATAGGGATELAFTFSEHLDPAFSSVKILDVRGAVIDSGPGSIDPTDPAVLAIPIAQLAAGSYVAGIGVRSADGHLVEYRVPFRIGSGTSAIVGLPPLGVADPAGGLPRAAETLLRWLSLMGAGLAGGAVTFALVVWRPGGPGNRAADSELSAWLRRWLLAGALTVVVGSCLLVVAQAATGAGVSWWGVVGRPLGQELGAHAGRIFGVRAILAVELAVVAWILPVHVSWILPVRPTPRLTRWAFPTVVTALVLATFSLGGHAPEILAQPAVPVALDYVHMAAMTAWLGGLPLLAHAARIAREQRALVPWLSELVRRFSGLALACVVCLGVTGIYAFSLDVAHLAPLTGTTYGRVLLVKLGLFAVLISLGAVNRLLVIPRLSGPPSAPGEAELGEDAVCVWAEEAERATAHLRWAVRVEIVTGALVLLAVAALTSLAPATVAWAAHQRLGPSQTVEVDNVDMTLRLAPGGIGDSFLAVDVVDGRTGAGSAPARVIIKRPGGQGVLDLPRTLVGAGGRERFSTDAFPIESAGPVDLDVTLEREGFRPVEHMFTLDIGAG